MDPFGLEPSSVWEATQRAFSRDAISFFSDRAFSTESTDPYAHERAGYDYGAYVGNSGVAGTARAIGEAGQAIAYGIETISRGSIDLLPGTYNPFNKAYLQDSVQDIRNVVEGAN